VVKAIDRFLTRFDSLDHLPPRVGTAVRGRVSAQLIQGIIVIPPQEYPIRRIGWLRDLPFGWRVTPWRTVVFLSQQIVIVDENWNGTLGVTTIPVEALTSLELGTVLLYAYVQFTWVSQNQVKSLKIEFNAADESIIRCLLDQLRATISGYPLRRISLVGGILADLPLKFRNYLRIALLPDEPVCFAVYQPPIRRAEGWLHALISPHRAVAVTDRHIILLEDDIRTHMEYSMTTRWCSLRRIRRVTFEPTSDAVWMHLSPGVGPITQDIDIPLDVETSSEVQGALERAVATALVVGKDSIAAASEA
jgi:hypothetical protein